MSYLTNALEEYQELEGSISETEFIKAEYNEEMKKLCKMLIRNSFCGGNTSLGKSTGRLFDYFSDELLLYILTESFEKKE